MVADTRKIIITTIHKFGEADGRLNERSNIIVMVDEAHRTQEGDLGRKDGGADQGPGTGERHLPHQPCLLRQDHWLIAAQDCLPDNEIRDKFAAEYSMLSQL